MIPSRAVATSLLAAILGLSPGCASCGAAPPSGSAEARRVVADPHPGVEDPPDALVATLAAAWDARSPSYLPRTRHLRPDGTPRYTNRLFLETSPYLLQHAHNPVEWFPWGDEAFARATALGRPVFLSVGYSTCHWCHVMEEESFEDVEIATFLNEHFVAIKVDREERPDVDAVYMAAVQAIRGDGGWPMSVWLTPDRKPFYAGTYFPARDGDRGAPRGFLTLLRRTAEAWDKDRTEVTRDADRIAASLQKILAPPAGGGPVAWEAARDAAVSRWRDAFDADRGGVRGAPKFPSSLPIRLLLREHRRTGDAALLRMATLTLERMATGGMRDQIGGGFHRYSTDARWLVPHFEKMLYDNALLAIAYLEAGQATGRGDFTEVARDTLRYLDRDMSAPDGAFYGATDADSPGPGGKREEGLFFTWTLAELRAAVGDTDAAVAAGWYDVTESGNYEGRSILHTPWTAEDVAIREHVTPGEVMVAVDRARTRLLAARSRRDPPLRDEKRLAAWNGLAISAFASAGLALGEPEWTARAVRAGEFIRTDLMDGARLRRTPGGPPGVLEDYTFVAAGFIDLYEATGEVRWLSGAISLADTVQAHFADPAGGYFRTADDAEALLAREKPDYDGAEPSGNSVHAMNLAWLAELTGDDRYRQRLDSLVAGFARRLAGSPTALPELYLALDFARAKPLELVIVAPRAPADAEPFLRVLRAAGSVERVLVVAAEGDGFAAHAAVVPLLTGKTAQGGQATAYVCRAGVCKLPETDPEAFAAALVR